MPKQIDDLRQHLFATLDALRDKESPMDIERAKAIAEVARVVVDSAKVEVQYIEVAGGAGSGFLPAPQKPSAEAAAGRHVQPGLLGGQRRGS